jgi:hypothetical protein
MMNFVAQVPEQEPAHPVDVYPLMIRGGAFVLAGHLGFATDKSFLMHGCLI